MTIEKNTNRNLFQRLLRPDGTWTTDVSGLLTQASSLTKAERRETLDGDFEERIQETLKVMPIARN